MRNLGAIAAFFSLGAALAAANAFLLRGMIWRLLRGRGGAPLAVGSFAGRMALSLLVFGVVAMSGSPLSILVCALGYASVTALILGRALRSARDDG